MRALSFHRFRDRHLPSPLHRSIAIATGLATLGLAAAAAAAASHTKVECRNLMAFNEFSSRVASRDAPNQGDWHRAKCDPGYSSKGDVLAIKAPARVYLCKYKRTADRYYCGSL